MCQNLLSNGDLAGHIKEKNLSLELTKNQKVDDLSSAFSFVLGS